MLAAGRTAPTRSPRPLRGDPGRLRASPLPKSRAGNPRRPARRRLLALEKKTLKCAREGERERQARAALARAHARDRCATLRPATRRCPHAVNGGFARLRERIFLSSFTAPRRGVSERQPPTLRFAPGAAPGAAGEARLASRSASRRSRHGHPDLMSGNQQLGRGRSNNFTQESNTTLALRHHLPVPFLSSRFRWPRLDDCADPESFCLLEAWNFLKATSLGMRCFLASELGQDG